MPKFHVEQIALCPQNPTLAIALLEELGLTDWARDHVVAFGEVFGQPAGNEADLAFNYQVTKSHAIPGSHISHIAPDGYVVTKPLELEVLNYTLGENWMDGSHGKAASHLAMHVTPTELDEWFSFFTSRGIGVAQAVNTVSHTNPVIKDSRLYTYVIFDTRAILSIDLKFIVRRDVAAEPSRIIVP